MKTEFEMLTQDALAPRTKQLLCDALDRFQQTILSAPDITSDADVEPLITCIVDTLMEVHLSDMESIVTLTLEHSDVFLARVPKSRPPDGFFSPAQLGKQNVREWLDYELWANWYLVGGTSSGKQISVLNPPPVPDVPLDHYIAVDGNHPLYLRYYADSLECEWWFVELTIDYDTHDHTLTIGPLSHDDLRGIVKALQSTCCRVHENWDGPLYIGDRLRMQEHKDGKGTTFADDQG